MLRLIPQSLSSNIQDLSISTATFVTICWEKLRRHGITIKLWKNIIKNEKNIKIEKIGENNLRAQNQCTACIGCVYIFGAIILYFLELLFYSLSYIGAIILFIVYIVAFNQFKIK